MGNVTVCICVRTRSLKRFAPDEENADFEVLQLRWTRRRALSESLTLSGVTVLDKGSNTCSDAPPQAPSIQPQPRKNPTKKAEAKGGPARAPTEGTRIESESGHRVGEVGHPD